MATCGTFSVESAFDPSLVSIQGCSTSPNDGSTIAPDDGISVTVNIVNDNSAQANIDIDIIFNGQVMETLNTTVGGGRSVTVTSNSYTPSDAGVSGGGTLTTEAQIVQAVETSAPLR